MNGHGDQQARKRGEIKSAEELQREVRQSRAEVEQTLDAIQERLSPGQLFEQAVDYMRSSSGNEFVRNLDARVRDNPLPVVLVGTGLAWLMMSGARSRRREEDYLGHYAFGDYPAGYYPDSHSAGEDRFGGERTGLSGETSGSWGAGARSAAASAAERAMRLGAGARERLGHTGEYLRHGVHGAGRYGRRAQSGFSHLLEEQPLVLGAIGLAVGAAIGAALPKTETEDEWMGDTRDSLKDRARRMTREQLERARAAARAAYEAAIDEADRQGWSAEGAMSMADAAAQKAERVATAATEAARSEAQRHGGGGQGGGSGQLQGGGSTGAQLHGDDQTGTGAPSQVSGVAGSTAAGARTEAERHGLGQTSSRIPSGT